MVRLARGCAYRYRRTIRTLIRAAADTASTLSNLAALYWAMEDYAKAEPLYKEVLQIWENALGPEHPYTAQSLNQLALLESILAASTWSRPLPA